MGADWQAEPELRASPASSHSGYSFERVRFLARSCSGLCGLLLTACPPARHEGSDGTAGTGGGPVTKTPAHEFFDLGNVPVLGPIIEPGDPGAADVVFTIRADSQAHMISPLIYGGNNGSVCSDANNHATVCRLGGNRWTAYNWENNASNAGRDWCFQNDANTSQSDSPAVPVLELARRGQSRGAATVVTVPIVDYVAADKQGGSAPPECSGDVRKSGNDYLTTRFRANLPSKNAPFADQPDKSDGFVYQDEFVAFLRAAVPEAALIFSLDNEPDLWSNTHAEVHPQDVTYAELVQRNVDYAKAIRTVWPESHILGFVSYGYAGYISLQSAPDANGNGPFIDFYLKSMKQAEEQAGVRLVDYLDVHWYPEVHVSGQRITQATSTPECVAARVQAPRSLWDPTYTEDSWIIDVTSGPIRLLPWLREKISQNYPGTQIAITEWNYGGGNDVSGGVATADVLGIYGREGVGLASYWTSEPYTDAGLRVFRNYDGNGAAFGDVSISAATSSDTQSSVYASIDSSEPSRTVVVAINRGPTELSTAIEVAHDTAYSTADVYTLTAAGPTINAAATLTASATNAFLYVMPAYSVSVIVPKP